MRVAHGGAGVLEISNRWFSQVPGLQFLLWLQVLDVTTTLVGLRLGLVEASPFVKWLIHAGPVMGLAASKCVAMGLITLCLVLRRQRVIRLAIWWYSGLVVWNGILIAIACYR